MKKKKKVIIIIGSMLLLIILGIIAYLLFFSKNYQITIYKYTKENKIVFSETIPKDTQIENKYDIKCKNKCFLITSEYIYNYFGISNEDEGYIYNISTNDIYNVGHFDKFSILTKTTSDDNNNDIGIIIYKTTDEVFYNCLYNIYMNKITIPWTKDFVIGIHMLNDNIIDTINSNTLVNITNGETYNIGNYKNYQCFTPNTCVFYEESGYGFIYNFRLNNEYKLNYNVVVDYLGGAIVLKDGKYMAIEFGKTDVTEITNKVNYKNIILGNGYTLPNISTNEIIIGFEIDKNSNNCLIYKYNSNLKTTTSLNDCSYFDENIKPVNNA